MTRTAFISGPGGPDQPFRVIVKCGLLVESDQTFVNGHLAVAFLESEKITDRYVVDLRTHEPDGTERQAHAVELTVTDKNGAPIAKSNEPEMVKAFSQMMEAGGQASDAAQIIRIYAEFKWGVKKAAMTGECAVSDVESLLDAAIKRLRKHIRDAIVRDDVIEKFEEMRQRLHDRAEENAMRADLCPKCELPKFLCPCE